MLSPLTWHTHARQDPEHSGFKQVFLTFREYMNFINTALPWKEPLCYLFFKQKEANKPLYPSHLWRCSEAIPCIWQVESTLPTCKKGDIPAVSPPTQTPGLLWQLKPWPCRACLPRNGHKPPHAGQGCFISPSCKDVDTHIENCNCSILE